MKEKRPYHHGNLREQLLLAGEEALTELPADAVSLREIARRAGVSHAAPKHHFAGMGEMLGEIAARGYEKFVIALDEASRQSALQDPASRLIAMGRAYLRFAESNAAVYSLMFGKVGSMAVTPSMVQSSMAAWEQLEGAVADLVGTDNSVADALLVFSTVHGLAMLKAERRLPPHVSPHAAEDKLLRDMVAGLIKD
jgi:AcrR family transcriptional regulator